MKSVIQMAEMSDAEARRQLEAAYFANAKPGDVMPKSLPYDELWKEAVEGDRMKLTSRIDELTENAYRRLGFEATMPLSSEADSTISNFERMDKEELTPRDVEALYSRYGHNRIARSRIAKLARIVGLDPADDPVSVQERQVKQMSEVAKKAIWSDFYATMGIEIPTDRHITPDQARTIIDNVAHGVVGFAAYLSDGREWADDGQGEQ